MQSAQQRWEVLNYTERETLDAFLRLPPDAGLVNIDLKLNYLQPANAGRLTATGRCIRPGRTLSYTEAHVYDERGELLAHGTSTLMALPGRGIDVGVAKFAA